ncbi:FAR-17a/AIG1-like protein [Caenorhabditis elegans]|uniref:FAR-17a/AIG1-like protein n=1 Tax=Caenorhabditis elegans TaxID=6239 RepID=Q93354_CAEEL|nr:FAR-17a/AIG1-like protein [Caenorhabditis elegans]CAB02823.1 FAR-17a/AIG1-like protein [Caenorhabditis elegans]|eukprot:NP_001024448.1 Uncharacterized protein CELE_C37E2.2 [Caenorhabditis elegans]
MASNVFLLFTMMSIIWLSALWFDINRQPRLGHHWYVYKLVMLTNLNFVLCVFYSVMILLGYKSEKLQKISDFMHFTSIFPVGMITCGLFWGLYAINPALVMPDWIAKLIPSWLNHITHTYPIIFIILDSYFHKRTPPKTIASLIFSAALVFVYFMIICYVRFFDGYWLYPILSLFAFEHFVISYIIGFLGFFMLIKAAVRLNKLFHQKDDIGSKLPSNMNKKKKF